MQLFITEYFGDRERITITEERVVSQLKKVLRVEVGYQLAVQLPMRPTEGKPVSFERLYGEIENIRSHEIILKKIQQEDLVVSPQQCVLCVAMPNKFEKIELIVQKVTEIGIQHMIFFPAEFSQIRDFSDSKMQRIKKITLEATEQSWGLVLPEILFDKAFLASAFTMRDESTKYVYLDCGATEKLSRGEKDYGKKIFYCVGPEGGRGEKDKVFLEKVSARRTSLGSSVLRTETAAIVAAWELAKDVR